MIIVLYQNQIFFFLAEWDYCYSEWQLRMLFFITMVTENFVVYQNSEWECCYLSEWWRLNVVVYHSGDWGCCRVSEWWLRMLLCIRMVNENVVLYQNCDWECCSVLELWLRMLLFVGMVTEFCCSLPELLVFFNRFS